MRRLYAWLMGAAGGLATYRALTRRRPVPAPVDDTRADELRAKLAEARDADEEPVDEADPLDPDARRARVHEQGRAAIDEMRGGD